MVSVGLIATLCFFPGSFAQTSTRGPHKSLARVPFVGCKSDGQVGPVDAPAEAVMVEVDARAAQKLAYYKPATSPGVLAPRGWVCYGVYGSGGSATFVTPEPIDLESMLSGDWRSFAGPAVEIDNRYGGTSGRDSVAKVIARVFPKYRAFVQSVVEMFEFLEPEMIFGPYPSDRLVYRSDRVVEFRTPPNSEGLGTMTSRFRPNQKPIQGVALLLGEMPEVDLLMLTTRLPPEIATLKSTIILQVEREAK